MNYWKMSGLVLAALMVATSGKAENLPDIGPAPGFELTAQNGERLALTDLKGKVVAVTFIYTACPDVCPLLSYKLKSVMSRLEEANYSNVFFVSITMDPERDTPDHLQNYATWLEANPERWAFLTGSEEEIRKVARDYGIYFKKQSNGVIDHNLLTSIVDSSGTLRVQYMGSQFNPTEFLNDLQSVADEGG